jgi:hypothetical protein
MPRTFDGPFWLGGALSLVTLAVAIGAIATPSLPVIGSGRGAVIAVAILGMAACAVGGIGQAPMIGWTNPGVIVGSVIGVLALVVIVAGFGVWPGLVQPVGDALTRVTGSAALTVEQSAIVTLAGIVLVKWVVGLFVALTRTAGA